MFNLPEGTEETKRFRTWVPRKNLEPVYQGCYHFAHGIYKHPFLTLYGPSGTGKTHLALAIGWDSRDRGVLVGYCPCAELLYVLRSDQDPPQKREQVDLILNYMFKVPLLIIDGLIVPSPETWGARYLDWIIDERSLHERPLVVCTSTLLNNLPPRIFSRLHFGNVLTLKTTDFRRSTPKTWESTAPAETESEQT